MSKVFDELKPQEPDEIPAWHLKIGGDLIYGAVTLSTLCEWASEGRITPGNLASNDQEHWVPAESIPELKMEWFGELKDGRKYGPFNLLAAPHLVQRGIISADAVLTNKLTSKKILVQSLLKLDASKTSPIRPPTTRRMITVQSGAQTHMQPPGEGKTLRFKGEGEIAAPQKEELEETRKLFQKQGSDSQKKEGQLLGRLAEMEKAQHLSGKDMETRLGELVRVRADVETRLAAVSEELAAARSRIAELEAGSAAAAELKGRIAELERDAGASLRRSDEKAAILEDKATQAAKMLEATRKELESARASAKAGEDELRIAGEKYEAMERTLASRVSELQKQVEQGSVSAGELKAQLDVEIAAHRQIKTKGKETESSLQSRIKQLEERLSRDGKSLSTALEETRARLARTEQERDALAGKNDSLSKEMQRSTAESDAAIDALKKTLESTQKDRKALETASTGKEKALLDRLSELEKENAQSLAAFAEAQRDAASLKKQTEKQRKDQKTADESWAAQKGDFETQISALKKEADGQSAAVADLTARLDTIQAEYDAVRSTLEQKEGDFSGKVADFERQTALAAKVLDAARKELEAERSSAAEIAKELDGARKALKKLEGDSQKRESELVGRIAAIEKAQDSAGKAMEAKLAESLRARGEIETKLAAACEELKSAKSRVGELDGASLAVEKLKARIGELEREAVASAEKFNRELNATKDALSREEEAVAEFRMSSESQLVLQRGLFTKQIVGLETELKAANAQIAELKKTVEAEISAATGNTQVLERRLQTQNEELEKTRRELDDERNNAATLSRTIAAKESELAEVLSSRVALEEEFGRKLAALQSEAGAKTQELEYLRKQTESEKSARDKAMAASEAREQELSSAVRSLETRVQELTATEQSLSVREKELQSEISAVRAQLLASEKKLGDSAAEILTLRSNAEVGAREHEARTTALEQSLNDAQKQISKLTGSLDEARSALNKESAELRAVREARDVSERQVARLTRELADAVAATDAEKAGRAELGRTLEAKGGEYEKALAKAAEACDAAKAEAANFGEQLRKELASRDELQKLATASERELTAKVLDLEGQLGEVSAARSEELKRAKTLEQQLKESKQEAGALKTDMTAGEKSRSDMQTENADLRKEIEHREEELTDLTRQIENEWKLKEESVSAARIREEELMAQLQSALETTEAVAKAGEKAINDLREAEERAIAAANASEQREKELRTKLADAETVAGATAAELNIAKSHLEAQIEEQERLVESSAASEAALNARIAEMNAMFAQAEQAGDEVRRKLEEERAAIHRAKEQDTIRNDELTKQMAELHAANERAMADLAAYTERELQQQLRVESLSAELQHKDEQLAASRTTVSTQNAELFERICKLEADAAEAGGLVERLVAELEAQTIANRNLVETATVRNREIEQHTAEIKHLNRELHEEKARRTKAEAAVKKAGAAPEDVPTWRIRLDDGSIYGPVGIAELRAWAEDCRIGPAHSVSSDGKSWQPASDVAALKMDWMVKLTDGSEFGPVNLFAIRQLVNDGAVDRGSVCMNRINGTKAPVEKLLVPEIAELRGENERMGARIGGLENELHEARTRIAELERKLECAKTIQPVLPPETVRMRLRKQTIRAS